MPFLDLIDALSVPDMLDLVPVIRRREIVTDGRVSSQSTVLQMYAVVTVASPNDLRRLGEQQFVEKAITIVTQFRLRSVSRDAGQNYMPDLVFWGGSYYLVQNVGDYAAWGAGWVQIVATSTEYLDDAPGAPTASLDFQIPSNSEYLPCL